MQIREMSNSQTKLKLNFPLGEKENGKQEAKSQSQSQ